MHVIHTEIQVLWKATSLPLELHGIRGEIHKWNCSDLNEIRVRELSALPVSTTSWASGLALEQLFYALILSSLRRRRGIDVACEKYVIT